ERESLIEERASAGGDRIGDLERLAREARAQAEQRRENRTRFDQAVQAAGFSSISTADQFADLTSQVAQQRPRLAEEKRRLDADTADVIGREKDFERRRDLVAEELASLEQRTSNLPAEQVDVR